MSVLVHRRVAGPLLVVAAGLAACAINPVTGERQLALISEGQEIEMGRQAAADVEQSIGLVDDAALQDYVHRLGTTLAARSERPGLPWSFRAVDDPTPNAFALPGGFIFVTRGLLALMNSEAELVSVLGHEVGHVTARHSVTMLSRAQLAQLGLGLGMVLAPNLAPFGELAGSGLGLLFLKYGRDAERQADDLGFRYALDNNYDVRRMIDVFAALQRVGEDAGQSPLPSWLASHPYPEERIERIRSQLAQLQQPLASARVGEPDYFARIDNVVYGDNPRAGYFDGSLFLHPDLRFRVQFPQGWRTQNLAQAVTAMSPGQDAVIQLTLGTGSAAQAAGQFAAQQGLRTGQLVRTTINGLPAVTTLFEAETEQGALAGVATFIEHDGNTFQILGYAPGTRYGAYEQVLRQTAGSFGRVTDANVLNVQPDRLDVIRITQAMTLTQFHARYPSVIPIGELALINQVTDVNARLDAGRHVKRVVRN